MDETEPRRLSALRLRVGIVLVLLWWLPFWALSPAIADTMSGLANPPSVAAVTTVIVVLQTIIGVVGFVVAGAEVKAVVTNAPKKKALGIIWYLLIHGRMPEQPAAVGAPVEPDAPTGPGTAA